jgi:hypothetical protein
MRKPHTDAVAWLLGGIAATFVLLALAYANVSLFLFPSVEGYCWPESPSTITNGYPYGWPFTCVGTKPYVTRWGTIWLQQPPQLISSAKLAANCVIALGIAACSLYVVTRRLRSNPLQLSLKSFFAVIGVCATYLGLAQGHLFFAQRFVEAICFVCILAGLMATYVAFFDLAGSIVRRVFVERRSES